MSTLIEFNNIFRTYMKLITFGSNMFHIKSKPKFKKLMKSVPIDVLRISIMFIYKLTFSKISRIFNINTQISASVSCSKSIQKIFARDVPSRKIPLKSF